MPPASSGKGERAAGRSDAGNEYQGGGRPARAGRPPHVQALHPWDRSRTFPFTGSEVVAPMLRPPCRDSTEPGTTPGPVPDPWLQSTPGPRLTLGPRMPCALELMPYRTGQISRRLRSSEFISVVIIIHDRSCGPSRDRRRRCADSPTLGFDDYRALNATMTTAQRCTEAECAVSVEGDRHSAEGLQAPHLPPKSNSVSGKEKTAMSASGTQPRVIVLGDYSCADNSSNYGGRRGHESPPP